MALTKTRLLKHDFPVHGKREFEQGQITHLICARLKYEIYMTFLGGVLGLLPVLFLVEKAQKHPLKKSYRSHILGGHRLDE